jgi:hypothetical protein
MKFRIWIKDTNSGPATQTGEGKTPPPIVILDRAAFSFLVFQMVLSPKSRLGEPEVPYHESYFEGVFASPVRVAVQSTIRNQGLQLIIDTLYYT